MLSLVSVVIPAYNSSKWLAATMESALGQTWPRVEIIVVDDGSTDETDAVLASFASKRVKLLRQENRGASAARNLGLHYAQGDFVQWLDADDLLHPRKIANQMRVADKCASDHVIFSAPCGHFFHDPLRATFMPDRCWADLSAEDWLIAKFEQGFGMLPMTWLASRSLLTTIGPWDESLTLDDDAEFSCRMVARSSLVKFVPDALCYYRRGNVASLGSLRSDEALDSLTRAALLSVGYLLELRNDDEAREACSTHLSNVAKEIFPRRPDLLEELDSAAQRIGGGTVYPIKASATLQLVAGLVGWKTAKSLKSLSWNSKVAVRKYKDELLFAMRGRSIKWHEENFAATLMRLTQ